MKNPTKWGTSMYHLTIDWTGQKLQSHQKPGNGFVGFTAIPPKSGKRLLDHSM